MSPAAMATVFKVLNSPEGKVIARMLLDKKNDNIAGSILEQITGLPTGPQDILDARELISSYNNSSDADVANTQRRLRNLMIDDPKTMLIKAGFHGLSEASRAVGNIAATNANRLAAAILAAAHTNSAKQDEIYGKSAKERAAEAYGQNRIRSGENIKHVTDAFSNTIDKALGAREAQEMAYRGMAAGQEMTGTPGSLYNMINGMQSRASKIGNKK